MPLTTKGRIVSTEKGGLISLVILPEDQRKTKLFLQEVKNREKRKGENPVISFKMEIWHRPRTLKQNALIWSLCEILSFVVFGDHGHKEEIYYSMICEKYAPRIVGKDGKTYRKSGSHCSTFEFAKMIEGAFQELAVNGVPMEYASQVFDFWKQWGAVRYSMDVDPVEAQTLEEYRAKIHSCEACGSFLGSVGNYKGNLAHIVSRGAAGENEPWNILHLCGDCHIRVQHRNGWESLMARAPHLKEKVNKARERSAKDEI